MNNTLEVLHLNRGSEIEHRIRKNNMSNQVTARTREKWVDDVKVIACILVVVGHFFMSMGNLAFCQIVIYMNGLLLQFTTSMCRYSLFAVDTFIKSTAR